MAYATFRALSLRLHSLPSVTLSRAIETSLWTNLGKASGHGTARGLFSSNTTSAGSRTICSRCASTLSGLSKAAGLSSISRIAQHGGRTFMVVRVGSRQLFRLYSTKGGTASATAKVVGTGATKAAKASQVPGFKRLLSLAKDEKWKLAGVILRCLYNKHICWHVQWVCLLDRLSCCND